MTYETYKNLKDNTELVIRKPDNWAEGPEWTTDLELQGLDGLVIEGGYQEMHHRHKWINVYGYWVDIRWLTINPKQKVEDVDEFNKRCFNSM